MCFAKAYNRKLREARLLARPVVIEVAPDGDVECYSDREKLEADFEHEAEMFASCMKMRGFHAALRRADRMGAIARDLNDPVLAGIAERCVERADRAARAWA